MSWAKIQNTWGLNAGPDLDTHHLSDYGQDLDLEHGPCSPSQENGSLGHLQL